MERYANLSGRSGVKAFESAQRSIAVQFRSGMTYSYTVKSAGLAMVKRMQALAAKGKGLAGFISKDARLDFASKARRR